MTTVMRKLVCGVLVVFPVLGACVVGGWLILHATVTPQTEYHRLAVANVVAQAALSCLTFGALFISLWMAGLKRVFISPRLSLKSGNDDLHCVLLGRTHDVKGVLNPRLSIYVHLENGKSVPAEGCRITCNELYVSVDGASFSSYMKMQTASLIWVNPVNREEPHLVTVRKRIEQYARIMEISEQDSESVQNDEGGETVDSRKNVVAMTPCAKLSWIEVCLPCAPEADKRIKIPTRYRAVLLPLTVVSEASSEEEFFLRVVWNGDEVGKYKQAGFLSVSVLSRKQATKLIERKCV